MLDILVPHYNYPIGVRLIEQDLKLYENKFNLIVSDDSDQNKLETTGQLFKGPQKGAVKNWNFLLDISKNMACVQDKNAVLQQLSFRQLLSALGLYKAG